MKNNKIYWTLWKMFVVGVVFVMMGTALVAFLLTFLLHKLQLLSFVGRNPLQLAVIQLLAVALVGFLLSLCVGRRFTKPISKMNDAIAAVAKGDFSVRIEAKRDFGPFAQAAQNFNQMVHSLSNMEILQSDFISNVSHEFNTPITSIEGYATLLRDPNITRQEIDEYTRMILDSTRQLSSLTSNVLKLSKLENHEGTLEKKRFALDEQIRQAILMLEPQWAEKHIDFEIDLPPADFYGNEAMLLQVWLNIIGNAIKFSPQDSVVTVKLQMAAGEMNISISDEGVGMDKDTMEHIFDKFYQGDKARFSSGNGLGLALSKRIVEMSEGRIAVESEYNCGATFTVSLPGSGA